MPSSTEESYVKERPIIFSEESITAILAGRKRQTRRPATDNAKCPYGTVGNRLWVREWWITEHRAFYGDNPIKFKDQVIAGNEKLFYRADYPELKSSSYWRNPLFMPRWASRLALEIMAVRREALHAISQEDVLAEGCASGRWEDYAKLWDRLNAKRGYDWESNPPVWVIEFRTLQPHAADS